MRQHIYRMLVTVMFVTLLLSVVLLTLPLHPASGSGFWHRLLRLLPFAAALGAALLYPVWLLSGRMSDRVSEEFSQLDLDAPETAQVYPELRPVISRVTTLNQQIATQVGELRRRQEQFQVLTENMHEGLILIDPDGRILSCNHAALNLLEFPDGSPVPKTMQELTEDPGLHTLIANALHGEHGELTHYHEESACRLIANPVASENSTFGAVLVVMDITEREKRDALRREFTSNVSHELKTPLTSIYGIADMIESGMVKSEDVSGFARRIRDESGRMISLIEDIIRLSRLDDDSFTEEVLPIDLYEIANGVLMQLRQAASTRGIQMTLTGETAPMRGVPVIVEEMIYNLCDNAVKYNVENGRITMHVKSTEQYAVFTVSDTGIGIPQTDRERVFERFYRVDKSHSRQIGGTGLGLSIVKHGALFHNALIELDSQLGSGTTVTLKFPMQNPDLT